MFFDTQYHGISQIIKSLNINTGVFMISAFVQNNTFYLYDPGCRLQGEAPDVILAQQFNLDHKKMLISNALDIPWKVPNNIRDIYKFTDLYAATVWIIAKAGTIGGIFGLDDIKNKFGVYQVSQRLYTGDTITDEMTKTEAQVVARIYTMASNSEQLENNILSIRKHIKVTSIDNQDLLIYE